MTSLAIKNAIKARSKNDVLMIQIDHPDGNMWFNTGYRNIDHDIGEGEQVWRGVGLITDLEMPERSSAIEISKFSISLNGVADRYQYLVDEKVRGNRIRIWIAFLNTEKTVIAIQLLEDAVQDYVGFRLDENGTSVLTLYCLGNFAFLARQAIGRWTSEHQRNFLSKQSLDPDSDIGFDDQHGIPEQNVAWYRP